MEKECIELDLNYGPLAYHTSALEGMAMEVLHL